MRMHLKRGCGGPGALPSIDALRQPDLSFVKDVQAT